MTRGIIGRVLVAGWLGVLTAPQVSAQAPNCKQWNTDKYFKTATVEDVTTCLVAGADVNALGEHAFTPLHFAAWYNQNPAVVEALLKAGADPKARDDYKRTPLHFAAAGTENPAVIEALLKAGADPMARNDNGLTPWDLAQGNEALKGSDAYQRLNEARFELPGRGAAGSPPASRVPPAN